MVAKWSQQQQVVSMASIQFLILQYGQSMLPLDQTICNGSYISAVKCQQDPITPGVDHITEIHISQSYSDLMGQPDPNLQQLDFPKLASLSIIADGTKNPDLNILDRIWNMPTLTKLELTNDSSIKNIPFNFPNNLPALDKILISSPPYLSINSPTFFNNSIASAIDLDGVIFGNITIDSTLNLPNLKAVVLSITSLPPITIDIQEKSFPSLKYLMTLLSLHNTTFIVNSKVIETVYIVRVMSTPSLLVLGNLTGLKTLELMGQFILPGTDFKEFLSLSEMGIDIPLLTTYPFTAFPSALTTFKLNNANFASSLPTIPVPSSLTIFDMKNNNLINRFPIEIFQNINGVFELDLSNNPNLQIDIPDSWCEYSRVNLENTTISSVPDCFYCYYGDNNPKIKVPVAPPSSFICDITFDSYNLYSIFGVFIVKGNNIGYGYGNPKAFPFIPNKQIRFTQTYFTGPPRDYNITFYPLGAKNVTFSIVEAAIDAYFSSILLSANGTHKLQVQFSAFNSYLNHSVLFTDSNTNCTVINQTPSSLTCLFPNTTRISPSYKFKVYNQYYQDHFSNNFNYPTVTSANYTIENRTLTLYGNYGPINPLSIVTVSNTINCKIDIISSSLIKCNLDSIPQPGPATLFVNIGGLEFTSSNLLYFPNNNNNNNGSTTGSSTTTNGGETNQQVCSRLTYNCYGHGYCDINGICQCDENYNQIDNCLTKYINTNITPNATNPTVSFDIDGIDFQFEIYSIQELDYDGSILKELLLTNQTWNVSISTNYITTFVDYQLLLGNNSSMYQSLLVSSEISFSSMKRNVTFGDTQLALAPGAIKIGFTINRWPYQSNLATLRVVFKSTLNNDQSITFDCEKQSIDSFTKDELSESIQYLRFIKDNIQFNGRFIDFVLSDGKKAYSKTELISMTPSDSSSDESIALIGINLPQCQSCQLDPDFTPLLIENDSNDCSSPSNTWKIAVGVVVGGVGLAAVAIGAIILIKKKASKKHYNNQLHKLNKSSSE
ncbi:hypothetical protein DFA_08817 [Cavenderia fasciculata]|uniref:ComC supersandwich domain-containing protein n=1 Tax=Cavenderia fasciculata TaxID=261658 RepID=F4Q4G7_CACFS|nr:uncharacterized protein DFA_08817 [Cavenderia fasciculata]EGG17816.1 hypothetical protein DFA_08817 [Cavenderia fasciculata]|eukprot:XP_004356300.1 hypothetical protein DFA_08817 [Cavenderia fasciculata]